MIYSTAKEGGGKMIFLGVDPGLSGAIALWQPDTGALEVHDMPTLRVKPGSQKRSIDAVQLARIADECCRAGVTLAVIEQAWPRPGEGSTQSHKNGANWGMAYMAVVAQFVPVETIAPAHWKRAMNCPAAKDGARSRASQLLPQFSEHWKRVKDDGRAEAALLALYAERRFQSRAVTP